MLEKKGESGVVLGMGKKEEGVGMKIGMVCVGGGGECVCVCVCARERESGLVRVSL